MHEVGLLAIHVPTGLHPSVCLKGSTISLNWPCKKVLSDHRTSLMQEACEPRSDEEFAQVETDPGPIVTALLFPLMFIQRRINRLEACGLLGAYILSMVLLLNC
jgi:hypothetical protein